VICSCLCVCVCLSVRVCSCVCMCVCAFLVKHERIKFLAVALRDSIEVYAWAPKPYNKFMSFKVCL